MNQNVARIGACAVLAWGALWGSAAGQTATPSPAASPRPSPAAFIARAHADVSVTRNSDSTVGARADAAIYQRGNLTRIDLLSLTASALPIPPLHFTAVLDGRARTVTLWNDQTRRYFVAHVNVGATPTPAPKATNAPGWLFDRRSPFADLDVLEFDLKMTGHTTTAGIPTTGFSTDLTVRKKGSTAPVRITGTAQLSDDYGGFPMAISLAFASAQGANKLSIDYAIDALNLTPPPASAFRLPRGYTKASSPFGVILGSGAPGPVAPIAIPPPPAMPSPSPAASPGA